MAMHTAESSSRRNNKYTPFEASFPPVPCPREFGKPNYGDNPSAEAGELMELALKHLNDRCMSYSREYHSYEFVEWGFCGGLHVNALVDDGIRYHLNFRVKVISKSPYFSLNGPRLIFAELRLPHLEAGYEVVICEDLGPEKFVPFPKLNGCLACATAPHDDVLVHATEGFKVGTAAHCSGYMSR